MVNKKKAGYKVACTIMTVTLHIGKKKELKSNANHDLAVA